MRCAWRPSAARAHPAHLRPSACVLAAKPGHAPHFHAPSRWRTFSSPDVWPSRAREEAAQARSEGPKVEVSRSRARRSTRRTASLASLCHIRRPKTRENEHGLDTVCRSRLDRCAGATGLVLLAVFLPFRALPKRRFLAVLSLMPLPHHALRHAMRSAPPPAAPAAPSCRRQLFFFCARLEHSLTCPLDHKQQAAHLHQPVASFWLRRFLHSSSSSSRWPSRAPLSRSLATTRKNANIKDESHLGGGCPRTRPPFFPCGPVARACRGLRMVRRCS